jgi:hypothetical protein
MKFQDGIGKMKNQLFTTTFAACLTIALAAPIAAPADPVVGQVSAPAAKTKRVVPAATRMNTPVIRRVDTQPLAIRAFATEAPAEACVYDDDYSTGANNNGTTFCSKKLGFQELPPERQGRISAANVPEGYVLVLYAGPGQSGATCRVAGLNAGLDPACNNMARGISLESATAAQAAQVEQDRVRRNFEAAPQSEGFAPQIERDRLAAVAAHDARAAEEREALSRMRQTDRKEADARDAAAADYEQRRMAHRPVRAASLAASGGCIVKTSTSDGGIIGEYFGPSEQRWTFPAHFGVVGGGDDNDIEYVEIISPYVRVTFFKDPNYRGPSITLGCGKYELIDEPENEISSLIVELLDFPETCRNMRVTHEIRKWDR